MIHPDPVLVSQRADNQAYHAEYDPLLKIFQLSVRAYFGAKQKIAADESLSPADKAVKRQALLGETIGEVESMLDLGGWRQKFKSDAAKNSPDAAFAMGHFFTTYMETGCFNRAIDFYNEFGANNLNFAQDAGILSNLAIAYNDKKNIDPNRPGYAEPAPDVLHAKEALSLAEQVISRDDFPPAIAVQFRPKLESIFARSLLLDTSIPEAQRTETARQMYKDAFNEEGGFSHYPAYNAMLLALKAGDRQDAETWAGLTYMATMRDGGIFSTDPLVISRTMVAIMVNPEMAQTPSGKTINTPENALAQFEKINIEDWQKQAIARDISGVMDILRQRGDAASLGRADLIRDTILPMLNGEKQARFTPVGNFVSDENTNLLSESSYTLSITMGVPGLNAGAGTIIPGNLGNGGIIPDIVLSNHDLAAFAQLGRVKLRDVLEKLGERSESTAYERIADLSLADLAKNIRTGNDESSDYREGLRLVTRAFALMKTRNMENLDGIGDTGHEIFDNAIKGSRELSGAPDGKLNNFSSPTNISSIVEERLLDCRMTNKIAPVLAKVAMGEAINDLIADTLRQVSEDPSNAQAYLTAGNNEMRTIRSQQLQTADLSLKAKVEADAHGKPKKVDGYYVPNTAPDAPFVLIEPHSVNLQPTRAAEGTIKNFIIADMFYNGESFDQSGKPLPGATYNLNGVAITEKMLEKTTDGSLAINLGTSTGLRGAPAKNGTPGPLIEVHAESKPYMLDRTRRASTAFQLFMPATMELSYGRPANINDVYDYIAKNGPAQAQVRARQLGQFHKANAATLQPTNDVAIAMAKPAPVTDPVTTILQTQPPQFKNFASMQAQINVASNAEGQRMAAQSLADKVAQLQHSHDLIVAGAKPALSGIVQQPAGTIANLYAGAPAKIKVVETEDPKLIASSVPAFLQGQQSIKWIENIAGDNVVKPAYAKQMAKKWAEKSIAALGKTIGDAMIASNHMAIQHYHVQNQYSAQSRLHIKAEMRK